MSRRLHDKESEVFSIMQKKCTPARVHNWPFQEDLTEPEGQALTAFRVWTRAQTDPDFRRNLEAWEILQLEVAHHQAGTFDYENAVQAVGKKRAPAYFAAVLTVSGLLPVFGSLGDADADVPEGAE